MELLGDIVSSIFWVLLAITILVFVHEMGHFLFAKLFKMRVDKFSIGFPPKILGRKIGETEYVIGATPLGGYVKIAGMVDESMDTDFSDAPPQPWEFRAKPVWQRIIVITAGVVFNVILAAIIFTSLKWTYGERYIPAENVEAVYIADSSLAYNMGLRTGDRIVAVSGKDLKRYDEVEGLEALLADPMIITVVRNGERLSFEGPPDIMTQLGRAGDQGLGISLEPSIVGGVSRDYPAAEIGLRPYDRIVAIDGEPVRFWAQMTGLIQDSEGESIALQWARPDSLNEEATSATVVGHTNGHTVYEAEITPRYNEELDLYQFGISSPTLDVLSAEFGIRHDRLSPQAALWAGLEDTWVNSRAIVTSLQRIFSGREDLRENLGGPIMVAKVTKEAADMGAPFFWRIVAVLSITLAIMNILPIPALDGGHLVFLIYEGITRREPSLRVRMVMQQVGMILLLVFMTFLVFNDILRF